MIKPQPHKIQRGCGSLFTFRLKEGREPTFENRILAQLPAFAYNMGRLTDHI